MARNSVAIKAHVFVESKATKMSRTTLKGSRPKPGVKAVIAGTNKKFKRKGDMVLANSMICEAIADIEVGIEFWKTIVGNRRAKGTISLELLNRGG